MRPSLILTAATLLVLACSAREEPPAPDTATTTVAPVMQTATATANPDDGQTKPERNHFKGWNVNASVVNEKVWLKETETAKPWPAVARLVEVIFNPAVKHREEGDHGTKEDPLHYLAYRIQPKRPTSEFRFDNQFTKPDIAIWRYTDTRPSWLLVPAAKAHKNEAMAIPEADHLLCYAVEVAKAFEQPVTASDQFTKEPPPTIKRLVPSHLCVPVWKSRDDGKTFEGVRYPDSYLAIYSYRLQQSEKYDEPVWPSDQFRAPQKLQVMNSEYLAVPSQRNPG
jgi:hypothetical protein